jgi:hypothetical protein
MHMSWSRQLRGLIPLGVITDGERQGKVRGGVRRDRLHIARELSLANRQANAKPQSTGQLGVFPGRVNVKGAL